MTGHGLILAAPTSGSGKTTITLAVLRALARRGVPVRGAKSGPDYIDPAFHAAACGQPCVNLDAWAMTPDRLRQLSSGPGLVLIEGAMGLFDGAPPDGRGSVADLARLLNLPVVLIVDAARMSQSVAPLVAGFAGFDPAVKVAGVILNRVGSARHLAMLTAALAPLGLPVLGGVLRDDALTLPARHLGLVQAGEHADLDGFLNVAADRIEAALDLDALIALAAPLPPGSIAPTYRGGRKRLALARDAAFAFAYPHQIADWMAQGYEIVPFSPLADEPVPDADRVFLPGGYPELHAQKLASNTRFLTSLREAAQSVPVYGECGGYMVLGETLTDAAGQLHQMAGLLGLRTSFQDRRLHLGYRQLTSLSAQMPGRFRGHEFHYATTLSAQGAPLFTVRDAEGTTLPPMGLIEGRVSGSFAHIIEDE